MSAPDASATEGAFSSSGTAHLRVTQENGIIILSDANTTVGYCRYSEDGEVEYLFVQSARRRQGIAMHLLGLVEQRVSGPLRFREPLSPMGHSLVKSYLSTRKKIRRPS
jgi:hypothetical protein